MTALLAPERDVDVTVVRRARRRPARRSGLVLAGLGALLVVVFGARVLLGDYTITIPDFFRIITGTEIPVASYIVMEVKLPRALLGVLVGVAFGVGGAVFQTTLRNPLASPDIIGVSTGASAAAVFAIVALDQTGNWISVAAMAGAIGVAILVRLVAGTLLGYRLVLVGIGVAAGLMSVIQYLFTRADTYDAQLALLWMTGSLNQVDWPTVRFFAVAFAVLLPLVFWVARALRITELGQDTAAALGVRPGRVDLLLLLAVILVAAAVAAAGPIAFVSFLAGPIARFLNRGRATLVGAGLVGAVIVVAADYAADYMLTDVNYPVGVVTGALGAPFLLWLLAVGRAGRKA
ncbi:MULTISPECIES: FecCD family ABC transporter permease [unclassified Nocardioides]|uniref:FecCD family ABC transporter permease n=1 Tax=unclassified Nocardioides TaxID=2615069 RepID=UPI0006F6C79F|nr:MULTISPECIES: iron chelate uptake ABC transporter family permease subunit [unclassified Nocardioides]KQY57128.1 enterobactin ABC transporter permease [Nocardioides sp. Root140]KRF11769.1 enterobactin ABC transporter permease [Nocardioides sp. Soil796]